MQRADICAVFLVLAITLVGTLVPTFSLQNSVIIGNTGEISTLKMNAKSGSIDDLQAAINAVHAAGGGTVIIPAGTFVFNPNGSTVGALNYRCGVKSYGGVNIIGQGINQTILQMTQNVSFTSTAMIDVDGSNGLPYTISGLRFQGYCPDEIMNRFGLVVTSSTDYRITGCWFDSFDGSSIIASSCIRGLVDHCNFTNSYKNNPPPAGGWVWGYGVMVWDISSTQWSDINTLLGQYYGAKDIVYVEDCWFSQCRHCVTCSQNGYYVARFNTVTNEVPSNFAPFDVHGFNYGRGSEVYNNTFYGNSAAGQAVWLRGGTNTVFNNTFFDCYYGVQIFNESAPKYQVQDTYVWGNVMTGGGTAFKNAAPTVYTENLTYFLYSRPSYTPFVYPHPLTLQSTT